MLRKEKGITLIALVITIIILIILAAVTIATVNGDNSLLGRAKLARCYNAYGSASDEIGVAYSALSAKITLKAALDSKYDACSSKYVYELLDELQKDLNGTSDGGNYKFVLGPIKGTSAANHERVIYIMYSDNNIERGAISTAAGKTDSATIKTLNGKEDKDITETDLETTDKEVTPKYNTSVYATINLKPQSASKEYDIMLPKTGEGAAAVPLTGWKVYSESDLTTIKDAADPTPAPVTPTAP